VKGFWAFTLKRRATLTRRASRVTVSPTGGRKKGKEIMTGPEVLDVARDSIYTLVVVSSPLMLVGLVVGVVISLFQALTQIQEMTLVFVPKILAIFVAMLIALPFMAQALQGHMMRLAAHIVTGG
jgi:flagellar biosynthetic protein FliQ